MTTYTVTIELEAQNKGQIEKWLDKMGESLMIYSDEIIGEDEKHYEERIRLLAADPEKYRSSISFTPDENYPDLSREELMLHTIMAISV